MPFRAPTFRPPRPASPPRDYDRQRGTSCERGYNARWQKFRAWFLSQPENVLCSEPGCNRAATVVDHIVPHRGDDELFWREGNHQALCQHCHNAKTRRGQ